MRTKLLLRTALVSTLVAGTGLAVQGAAVAAPPAGAGKPLTTALEPGQEVGDFAGVDDASGSAAVRLVPGEGRICVTLRTEGLADLALAHIHEGERGENGDVVVNLSGLIRGDRAQGCVTVTRERVREIAEDPAGYYVNVHEDVPGTVGFSRGIRGQLG